MKYLNNMSAPPRTKAEINIKQIDRYLVFSPLTLARQLKCSLKLLPFMVKEYVDGHKNIFSSIKRPNGYMIANVVPNIRKTDFHYEICKDIDLEIIIFGSTVNGFYIPNRELSWDEDKFANTLCFLRNEALS